MLRSAITYLFLFLCFGLSCSNDPLPSACADPLGTDHIKVNRNQTFCFTVPVTGCTYNGCFWLTYNLPQTLSAYQWQSACTYGEIADVGVVKCIGEIKKTSSGFTNAVFPTLHHGYLIRFPDSTYGRFFIDSWIQRSGHIDSMYIARQYPMPAK